MRLIAKKVHMPRINARTEAAAVRFSQEIVHSEDVGIRKIVFDGFEE